MPYYILDKCKMFSSISRSPDGTLCELLEFDNGKRELIPVGEISRRYPTAREVSFAEYWNK